MRSALIFAPLALLVACGTPQQQCINNATRELRVLNSLVAETEANLRRGYALETVQEVVTVRDTCTGRNEDDTEFTFRCERTDTRDRERPVAIDLNAEQAKLNSLRERQGQLERQAQSAIQSCQATYPE